MTIRSTMAHELAPGTTRIHSCTTLHVARGVTMADHIPTRRPTRVALGIVVPLPMILSLCAIARPTSACWPAALIKQQSARLCLGNGCLIHQMPVANAQCRQPLLCHHAGQRCQRQQQRWFGRAKQRPHRQRGTRPYHPTPPDQLAAQHTLLIETSRVGNRAA